MNKRLCVLGLLLWGFSWTGIFAASTEPELWTQITTLFAPYDKDMLYGSDSFRKDASRILPLVRQYQKDFPEGPHKDKNRNIMGWAMAVSTGKAEGDEKTALIKEAEEMVKDTTLDALAQTWLILVTSEKLPLEQKEKKARELYYRFPTKRVPVVPYFFTGKEYEQKGNQKKALQIYTECTTTPDKYFRNIAINSLNVETVPLNKPIRFEFTAFDGSKVDTDAMKGKVIVVDFWAIECGACVLELPKLSALYEKYHDKGLEIIGINMDEDRKPLEEFLKAKNICWPQYFDGLGWGNQFATRYSVSSMPTVWLIDQKGILVSTDARQELAERIQSLMHGKGPLTFSQRTDVFLDYFTSKDEYLSALKEYVEISKLSDGEALRYIPEKYEKGRIARILDLPSEFQMFRRINESSNEPKENVSKADIFPATLIQFLPDELYRNKASMKNQPHKLIELIQLKGYRAWEILGEEKVLNTSLPGDYVMNIRASEGDYFKDLIRICRDPFNLPVRLKVSYEPQKVLVASGTYKFNPIFKDQGKDIVYITDNERSLKYNDDPPVSIETLKECFDSAFNPCLLNNRIFVETNDGQMPQIKAKYFGISVPADINQLIDYLSRQTGLTFSYQVRNLPVVHEEVEGK